MAIDEMVIGWKGHWPYEQYNAAKPQKYHIKTFGLCDSKSGYVYNLLVYFGKDTSYDPKIDAGCTEKVFEYLMQPFGPGLPTYLPTDIQLTKLIQYLSANIHYNTGTLNMNREKLSTPVPRSKTGSPVIKMVLQR